MALEAKWLEILKASGWQTAALAAAFGLALTLSASGAIPPFTPWALQLLVLAFLICGFLALGSLASEAVKVFPLHLWLARALAIRRESKAISAYIPHMTAKEREIIGYLLAKNQKMFTCSHDGGYAATLVSRGIIVRALRAGQVFDVFSMPFMIPDHVWEALLEQRSAFPAPSKKRIEPWYDSAA